MPPDNFPDKPCPRPLWQRHEASVTCMCGGCERSATSRPNSCRRQHPSGSTGSARRHHHLECKPAEGRMGIAGWERWRQGGTWGALLAEHPQAGACCRPGDAPLTTPGDHQPAAHVGPHPPRPGPLTSAALRQLGASRHTGVAGAHSVGGSAASPRRPIRHPPTLLPPLCRSRCTASAAVGRAAGSACTHCAMRSATSCSSAGVRACT